MGLLGSITKTLLGNKSAKRQRQKINAMEDVNQGLYNNAFADTQAAYQRYEQPGINALGRLDRFASGDQSQFTADPGYQFVRDEGTRDIGNSFAAKGGAFSGNALRALSEFNQGLASQEVGNWWGRNRDLVGIGMTATNNISTARDNNVNALAQSNRIKAGASAAEVGAKYNNYSGLVNDIESAYGAGGSRSGTGLGRLLARYGG